MKKRIRHHFSLGMQLREQRWVDDLIQHLTERKQEILAKGYDLVWVEMLDPCDSDDGMARLMLIGERDETDQEYEARTKKEQKYTAAQQLGEQQRNLETALSIMKEWTQEEVLTMWREAKKGAR